MTTTDTTTISEVQELQFALMRKATFNEFNGDHVVDSLLAHRDLWEGAVMDRADYYYRGGEGDHAEPVDLIKLRDIAAGYWNVNTVYLLAATGQEDKLELLVRREWYADEIDWMHNTHVGKYLRVWWD